MTVVIIHNNEDSALDAIKYSKYLKPTVRYGYGNVPDENGVYQTDQWYRGEIIEDILFGGRILTLPEDRYEILSMIADSHSKALGNAVYDTHNVGGPINESLNVNLDSQFSFGEDHSAQFRSSNMKRKEYWLELYRLFGLSEN
jgi:hypothetical protein